MIFKGYITICELVGTYDRSISISAHSEEDPENRKLQEFLETLTKEKPYRAKKVEVSPMYASILYRPMTENAFIKFVNTVTEPILDYLIQNHYESGCMECGSPYELSVYEINGTSSWLCGSCASRTLNRLEREQEEIQNRNSYFGKGICGALLGILAGIALYVVLGLLGYVAAISGLLMALLSMKLYEKFGGCLDKKGILACIALLLLAVPLANRLTWTGTAFYALKDYGWTLGECFRDLNYIIESTNLQRQFRADLMLGYFFTLLGSVFSFVRAFRGASGKFVMKRADKKQ